MTVRNAIRSLLLGLLLLVVQLPAARPAQAEAPTYGYLWSLEFDFATSFNGTLRIEVGPWQDGELLSVDARSKEIVACTRKGALHLNGGRAVFTGGYLVCTMDLAASVLRNHGLVIAPIDSYGSILMESTMIATAPVVAPIFSHPDAQYHIDFTTTSSVALHQNLSGAGGVLQQGFGGVIGASVQSYRALYGCIPGGGACSADFEVAGYSEHQPTAGERVRFQTSPTTFLIGSDGSTTFRGQMDSFLIDPGNSVQ